MSTIKNKPFVVQKISIVGTGTKGDPGPQGPQGPPGESVALPIDSDSILYDGQLLSDVLDSILYTAIDITALSSNISTIEVGSPLDAFTLSWTLNKSSIVSQQITGTNIPTTNPVTSARSQSFTGVAYDPNAIGSASYTLTVDDGTNTDNRSTSINFWNKRYWLAAPSTALSNAFILSMNSELSNSKSKNISYPVVGANDYLWYCYPSRLGTVTLTDAETGFPAGFNNPITFSFTNNSGFTEDYYVYRSTNAGLGAITVIAS